MMVGGNGRAGAASAGGEIAATVAKPVTRALEAADLGLSRAAMQEIRGTVLNEGSTRILTVDMIRGQIPVGELRGALSSILKSARADGVRVLQIEATFANEALEKFAVKQVEKLGGTVSSAGGKDTITFVLGGRR